MELQVDDAKLHEWSAKRTIRRFLRKKAEWISVESKLLFREIRTFMNPSRSRSASNMIRLLRQSSIMRTVHEVYAAAEDAGASEMRVSEETMELVRSAMASRPVSTTVLVLGCCPNAALAIRRAASWSNPLPLRRKSALGSTAAKLASSSANACAFSRWRRTLGFASHAVFNRLYIRAAWCRPFFP